MTENNQDKAGAGSESLEQPHPAFPSISRAELYDFVTRMFLDSGSDEEVAKALSDEFKQSIAGTKVNELRREAALAAVEEGSVDVRRRWIYRYSQLTVNNLVKEQMFMENKHDFLAAKMELAEEIEALSQDAPEGRLWIAVNDALGRNNIDLKLINELIAYSRHARELETLILPVVQSSGSSIAEEIRRLWDELGATGLSSTEEWKLSSPLAGKLGVEPKAITPEMIGVMREYIEFRESEEGGGELLTLIGEEDVAGAGSLLERVRSEREEELTPREIGDLEALIKAGEWLSRDDLESSREYAERHISHHAIRKEIWSGDLTGEQQEELKALLLLQVAVAQRIKLLGVQTFFTQDERDVARAAGVRESELKGHLDKLNALKSIQMVATYLSQQKPKGKFEFPGDRYCRKRFGRPLPA